MNGFKALKNLIILQTASPCSSLVSTLFMIKMQLLMFIVIKLKDFYISI